MSEQDNDTLTLDEREEGKSGDDKEGKGKSGRGEAGAMGRGEVAVSEGFYTYMASIGASVGQISDILKNWRQLRGSGLSRAIMDFARAMTRASAHAQVEIAPNKDYGLIHNLIRHMKSLGRSPEHSHTHTHTHTHKNTPGPQ